MPGSYGNSYLPGCVICPCSVTALPGLTPPSNTTVTSSSAPAPGSSTWPASQQPSEQTFPPIAVMLLLCVCVCVWLRMWQRERATAREGGTVCECYVCEAGYGRYKLLKTDTETDIFKPKLLIDSIKWWFSVFIFDHLYIKSLQMTSVLPRTFFYTVSTKLHYCLLNTPTAI